MSCTIATLSACFSLSGIYVDAGLLYSDQGEARIAHNPGLADTVFHVRDGYGHPYDMPGQYQYDAQTLVYDPQNPYARIAIGYDVQWNPKWSTRIDLSHESSIATGQDRGAEKVGVFVMWRPFAK